MKKKANTFLGFRLTAEQMRNLDAIAKRQSRTRADVVRHLLAAAVLAQGTVDGPQR
ncbi:MAG: hypothetical protein IMZ46_20935 [Acidobacteria bacterium]|nr:hypothetical protein [Acidobacteriota bacterium]